MPSLTTYQIISEFTGPKLEPKAIEGYMAKQRSLEHKVDITREEAIAELLAIDRDKKIKLLLGLTQQDAITPKDRLALKGYLESDASFYAVGRYLFGDEFVVLEGGRKVFDRSRVSERFLETNGVFHYFETQNTMHQALYLECFRFCTYQALIIEDNAVVDEIYQRAYKMMALFSPAELSEHAPDNFKKTLLNLDKFAARHLAGTTSKPVHDALMHALPVYNPEHPDFTLGGWKQSLMSLGMSGIKYFSDADEIERLAGGVPANAEILKQIIRNRTYQNAEAHPKLAELYQYYEVDSKTWAKTLELIDAGKLTLTPQGKVQNKSTDSIPDIQIEVPSKSKESHYYFVKLPTGDARALILGHITDCCQSVGGASEECVLDGVSEAHNGFYVLLKTDRVLEGPIDWDNLERNKHRIVGQSYVWRGTRDGLVLDSLEIFESFRKQFDLQALFNALVIYIQKTDERIHRVLLGVGGGTQDILEAQGLILTTSAVPEKMLTGEQYGDSVRQIEIGSSPKLKLFRAQLREKTGVSDQDHVSYPEISDEFSPELYQLFADENRDILAAIHGDAATYVFLTSSHCAPYSLRKLYEQLKRLKEADAERYYTIIKDRRLIEEGIQQVPVAELFASPADEILDKVRACYRIDGIKEALKNQWLTSLADLTDVSPYKMAVLFSENALELYKRKFISFAELKVRTKDEIQYLTSNEAMECYQNGWVTFNDLINLNAYDIWLFTCHAKYFYQGQWGVFKDLQGLDVSQIPTLISNEALAAYEKEWVTFDELKTFTADKIIALVSEDAQKLYAAGYASFDTLKTLETDKIKALTSIAAWALYEGGWASFDTLKDLDVDKIEALASGSAPAVYAGGWLTVEELKSLDAAKISALVYFNRPDFYQGKWASIAELKTLGAEMIRALTSYQAVRCYQSGVFTFAQLKGVGNADKISALSSNPAFYESGVSTAEELMALEADNIRFLISEHAQPCYREKHIDFSELKKLTVDSIRELTSGRTLTAYRNKWATFEALRDMEPAKIQILFCFRDMDIFYKNGWLSLEELKDLDIEKIRLFTTPNARILYEEQQALVKNLKDLSLEDLQKILSWDAATQYKKGVSYQDYAVSQGISLPIVEEKEKIRHRM